MPLYLVIFYVNSKSIINKMSHAEHNLFFMYFHIFCTYFACLAGVVGAGIACSQATLFG